MRFPRRVHRLLAAIALAITAAAPTAAPAGPPDPNATAQPPAAVKTTEPSAPLPWVLTCPSGITGSFKTASGFDATPAPEVHSNGAAGRPTHAPTVKPLIITLHDGTVSASLGGWIKKALAGPPGAPRMQCTVEATSSGAVVIGYELDNAAPTTASVLGGAGKTTLVLSMDKLKQTK